MEKSAHRGNVLVIVLIVSILVFAGIAYLRFLKNSSITNEKTQPVNIASPSPNNQKLKSYTSQNLKISFKYPKDWYVEDEYPSILISNFKSSLHKNFDLKKDQIEILVNNLSKCFPTLEEDLIKPACGQGAVENKIISKEVIKAPGGEFLKYKLDSPDEYQRIQYFFQKGEKILQIEKHPDPSQFEKEFEEIVASIEFL